MPMSHLMDGHVPPRLNFVMNLYDSRKYQIFTTFIGILSMRTS